MYKYEIDDKDLSNYFLDEKKKCSVPSAFKICMCKCCVYMNYCNYRITAIIRMTWKLCICVCVVYMGITVINA